MKDSKHQKDIDRISIATGIEFTFDPHLRLWEGSDEHRELFVWKNDGVWRYTVRVKERPATIDDRLSQIIKTLNNRPRRQKTII